MVSGKTTISEAMVTPTNHATTTAAGRQDQEDQQLLASLTPNERELVEWSMANFGLSARDAFQRLRANGM